MDAANAAARPLFAPIPVRTRPFRATTTQVATVTDEELDSAAQCVAAQFEAQSDYIRLSTWIIGALPVIYGVLTWVFGDALWASSPVYRSALLVPYAPQSWGTVFIALGALSIALAERDKHRADAVCCHLMAVILAAFMVSFALVAYTDTTLSALPPTVVYGLFALLYMNRGWMAWKSRRR